MLKLGKFLIGLFLLPACLAATRVFMTLLESLRMEEVTTLPRGVWWLAGGFIFWLILFFTLSRPIRTYVLAHELTHAFWGVLMGARVSRLRVSKSGGSVMLTKTNFIITLAPYFFPFYTVLVIVAHLVLQLFYDLTTYEPLWLALIGLTWAFHLTFTITTLLQHQPDVQEHGKLFSYVIIYLFNILGIGLWIVSVASPTLIFLARELLQESASVYGSLLDWLWTLRSTVQPAARK